MLKIKILDKTDMDDKIKHKNARVEPGLKKGNEEQRFRMIKYLVIKFG